MIESLNKNLILVSGKGGVGKSILTATLGQRARSNKKRALLVEIGPSSRLPSFFGIKNTPAQRITNLLPAGDGKPALDTILLEPEKCMQEYLELKIKIKTIARIFAETKVFAVLLRVAPGLNDLVTAGKIYHEVIKKVSENNSPYDLVVVDAPATGHGLSFLSAPKNYAELFPSGPIHDDAKDMVRIFTDPVNTGVFLVTLPEEMPVTETVEFTKSLDTKFNMKVDAIVLNKLFEAPSSINDLKDELKTDQEVTVDISEYLEYINKKVSNESEQIQPLSELDIPLYKVPDLFWFIEDSRNEQKILNLFDKNLSKFNSNE
jgi:anion-transporting  ArsA/GET3 family ATPase